MGRAELRRQAKSRKKEQEKISKVLRNAGKEVSRVTGWFNEYSL